ncbi:MAG: hypothetical protein ACREA2_07470 [Blastocatellia bacterium]
MISATRVLLSGLLAGLALLAGEYTFNVLLLGQDLTSATRAFAHLGPHWWRMAAPLLALNTLALGVALMWIYAVIQTQFGAGFAAILRVAQDVGDRVESHRAERACLIEAHVQQEVIFKGAFEQKPQSNYGELH